MLLCEQYSFEVDVHAYLKKNIEEIIFLEQGVDIDIDWLVYPRCFSIESTQISARQSFQVCDS